MTGKVHSITSHDNTNRTLLHDLNGPLINISGFSSEIRNSLKELQSLLTKYAETTDDPKIEAIFQNDLFFCINCIDVSIEDLRKRQHEYLGTGKSMKGNQS